MKLCLIVQSVAIVVVLSAPAAHAADACLVSARASVAAIAAGDFQSAGRDFSPAITSQFPPAKIEQAWQAVQKTAGEYRAHGTTTTRELHGRAMEVTPVTFAHADWDFLYTCDDQGHINTASLLPAAQLDSETAAERRAAAAKMPIKAHVLADGARVEPLSVPSPYGPLRGALTLPAGKGPFPAVVMVSGSGPNDLDEAIDGNKPLRDLADGLAAAGIASLRYDKRQTDYPFKMAANAHLTVDEEETDDALTAVHLLAKQQQVDPRRMFVLGHSEGGMLAPRIGQRDPQLAGVIMMASPARGLLAVIRQQAREQGERMGLPKASIDANEKTLAGEQALLDKADLQHAPQGSFGGAPQSWWLSLHDYDQVAVAKALALPMLILQGGGDFQVSPTLDFARWQQALAGRPHTTFHLYPGLSHLFMPAGKTGTPADYKLPAHVDAHVIADIAAWVKAQPAR